MRERGKERADKRTKDKTNGKEQEKVPLTLSVVGTLTSFVKKPSRLVPPKGHDGRSVFDSQDQKVEITLVRPSIIHLRRHSAGARDTDLLLAAIASGGRQGTSRTFT